MVKQINLILKAFVLIVNKAILNSLLDINYKYATDYNFLMSIIIQY